MSTLSSSERRWIARWTQQAPPLADSDWDDMLSEVGRVLPLHDVPPSVRRDALDAFSAPKKIVWRNAPCIVPFSEDDRLVGVRDHSVPESRRAVFANSQVDVVIDVTNGRGNRFMASGQILPVADQPTVFSLELAGPDPVTFESDEFGQFEIGTIGAGEFELRGTNGRVGVVLTFRLGADV